MARGDGKAQRGYTRGKGVIKMAAGGNLAARDAAMGGAAVGSRAEASRSTSSGGLGASTRDGGFGGSAGSAGGGGRSDMRSPVSTAARGDYLRDATRASVRLGPNAAQAMAGAGVNPDVANLAARSINRMASSPRNVIGDPNPGQRMATYNADGSISYSAVPNAVTTQRKQIYDRILPETAVVGGFGPFNPSTGYTPKIQGTPIDTGWNAATGTFNTSSPAAPKSPMAVYGNEFSFTPEQTTDALKSLYSARQPGASYKELMGLKSAMQEPTNKSMASTLAAPFSNRTRAPMAPVSAPDRSVRPASTLAGYSGQEQRFAPAPTPKQIYDKITPGGIKEIYDRHPDMIETGTPKAPAGRPAAPSVVAGGNFTAGSFPYRERGGGGGRGIRKKKKPIAEETTTAVRDGGSIRGDGKTISGKTKGRMV